MSTKHRVNELKIFIGLKKERKKNVVTDVSYVSMACLIRRCWQTSEIGVVITPIKN